MPCPENGRAVPGTAGTAQAAVGRDWDRGPGLWWDCRRTGPAIRLFDRISFRDVLLDATNRHGVAVLQLDPARRIGSRHAFQKVYSVSDQSRTLLRILSRMKSPVVRAHRQHRVALAIRLQHDCHQRVRRGEPAAMSSRASAARNPRNRRPWSGSHFSSTP